jgi:hypothetical protein
LTKGDKADKAKLALSALPSTLRCRLQSRQWRPSLRRPLRPHDLGSTRASCACARRRRRGLLFSIPLPLPCCMSSQSACLAPPSVCASEIPQIEKIINDGSDSAAQRPILKNLRIFIGISLARSLAGASLLAGKGHFPASLFTTPLGSKNNPHIMIGREYFWQQEAIWKERCRQCAQTFACSSCRQRDSSPLSAWHGQMP